jgi:hypothetical protein
MTTTWNWNKRVAQGEQKATETTDNTTDQQEVTSPETAVGAQGGRLRKNKKAKGGLTFDGVAFDGM